MDAWTVLGQVAFVAVQLFAILNPLNAVPFFLDATNGDKRKTVRFARYVTWSAFGLMAVFGVVGNYVLIALGVNLASLQLGGGLLLIALALNVILGPKRGKTEEGDLVPIITPLLVGPGTITALIVMSASFPAPVILAGVAVAAISAYACLRSSSFLLKVLKREGISALAKLMAVFVAAIGVEMVHSALLAWGIAKS